MAIYQNVPELPRRRHSSISKVETVVSVKREMEEEQNLTSITSTDYSLLTEEVQRLQKQLSGMDDSRRVYEAATKQLVSFLELVSSQLKIESVLESVPPSRRQEKQARLSEFEEKNLRRMQGSRMSDIGLSNLGVSDVGLSDLSLSDLGMSDLGPSNLSLSDFPGFKLNSATRAGGRSRMSLGDTSSSSSFRRQRGLRRRPVSALSSPLLSQGKGSLSSEGSEGEKDSGRFTDSERGSPTVGGSRRRELGERGAALVRQVRRFLGRRGEESGSRLTTNTPATPVGRRTACHTETPVSRRTTNNTESPVGSCVTNNTETHDIRTPSSSRTVSMPRSLTRLVTRTTSTGGKENRKRVVIIIGGDDSKHQGERRKSSGSVSSPRRAGCSIETDARGTVVVPVPFIQPPGAWL